MAVFFELFYYFSFASSILLELIRYEGQEQKVFYLFWLLHYYSVASKISRTPLDPALHTEEFIRANRRRQSNGIFVCRNT